MFIVLLVLLLSRRFSCQIQELSEKQGRYSRVTINFSNHTIAGFHAYRVAISTFYDVSDNKSTRIFCGESRLMHSTGVSRQQVRFRHGEQNSAWVRTRTCAPEGLVLRQSVAPKRTSVGRPRAPAMWAGPESVLRTAWARSRTVTSVL